MKTTYIENATVLIVDDNPTNLDVLCNYLTHVGADVLVKRDGESCVETSIRKKPDIIVLDIMMPYIDGYETCRRLKANPATASIPVIFASALSQTVDKVKGFSVGAVDYITKPFQIEEVLARIETHLSLIKLRQQLEIQNQELQQAKHDLEIANQKLYLQTISDGLTQIANRRHFDAYLNQEWQRALREQQSLALLLCDIDHFKFYNDTYGHQGGDDCLKQVAQAIKQVLKRPSDLAARYGGEEFAVILPHTELEGAIEISEQVCQAVRDLNILHEKSSAADYVTLSLGISCIIPDFENSNIESFIETADQALYQAKKRGRNQFCYV